LFVCFLYINLTDRWIEGTGKRQRGKVPYKYAAAKLVHLSVYLAPAFHMACPGFFSGLSSKLNVFKFQLALDTAEAIFVSVGVL